MATVLKGNFAQAKSCNGFVMIQRDDLATLGNDGAAIAIWTILNEWRAYKAGARQWGGETVFMEVGDVLFAERSLAEKTGFTRAMVRRVISTLEKLGLVGGKRIIGGRYTKGTLIRILKITAHVATHATAHEAPAGTVEPQGVQSKAFAEQPTQQPTQQPRSNKGEKKNGKSKTICPASRDAHKVGELLFIEGKDGFVSYAAVMTTCETAMRRHGIATLWRLQEQVLDAGIPLPLTFNAITFLNNCARVERGDQLFRDPYEGLTDLQMHKIERGTMTLEQALAENREAQ